MSDYVVQSETEWLVLTHPELPPIFMPAAKGLNVGTARTVESYASTEQAETRMRELVPGWEPQQENE